MEEIKTYLKNSRQENDPLSEDKELSVYEKIADLFLQAIYGYTLDSVKWGFVCEDAEVYNKVKEIYLLDEHITSLQEAEKEVEIKGEYCLCQACEYEYSEEQECEESPLEGLKRQKLFSLKELCEYCKNRVEWRDAKDIVAMLKELCWKDGNVDDMELIMSIEEEFKNRTYGNTTIGYQTVIQHVDNYKPQIQKQSVQLGMPTTGQEETKKLIDGKG